MGEGMRDGRPLSDFPDLQHLIEHDAWLAATDVRVQAVWEAGMSADTGHTNQRYTGYIISRRRETPTLVMLIRHGSPPPVYLKLYDTHTEALIDSASLAREIERNHPPVNHHAWADKWSDAGELRVTWCVRVVQRLQHAELQIVESGLLPHTTRIHATLEDALLDAEECLTDRYLTT